MFRVLYNTSKRGLAAGSTQVPSLSWSAIVKSTRPAINQPKIGIQFSVPVRSYSDDKRPEETVLKRRLLPPLMSFEEVIWPSIIKSIRSFIFVHFIIRPYLDEDFVVKDFQMGAKQAVQVISNKLASGDWEGLKDFVTDDIIPELKENLGKMNVAQRSLVAIAKDDIYLTFPYQVSCPSFCFSRF